MISTLGFELNAAKALLNGEGFVVLTEEVRSRGGVMGGNEARVVKQRRLDENTVELTYAIFKTEVSRCEDK